MWAQHVAIQQSNPSSHFLIISHFFPLFTLPKQSHTAQSIRRISTMSIPTNPLQKSPERAYALQRYLLLHSQHDALRKHLDNISQSPSSTASTASSPLMSTSPTSPASFSTSYHTQRRHRRSSAASYATPSISPISELPPTTSSPSTRPELLKRRSLPPVLSGSPSLSEIEEEELKLMNINLQIKATLTELLNCESVRKNQQYRMWIQTRLMDAERELKGSRSLSRTRRRSIDVGNISLISNDLHDAIEDD